MEIDKIKLLTEIEAALYLSLKRTTLACWRSSKLVNLPYIKIGGAVRYKLDDLDQYLEANKHGFTS